MKYQYKEAFTLMELIIALFIGTMVLLITFSFVTDTVAELAKSKKKSDFLTHYYDFVEIFKNQKYVYIEPVVIVDTTEGSGNDVILLKNTDNT
ncbi:MAG: prepilin-type N-terminal cleavage/methylation domain-containing protein [Candidatus Peribacteria bacterium]|nr:MAG: prepilin-type N-terminal cleavage/methylation domain-containing protein [Candidatus Peribacteria bacterium]